MPCPNSTLPQSTQLRLYNYGEASMGRNADAVGARLLTNIFVVILLGHLSVELKFRLGINSLNIYIYK